MTKGKCALQETWEPSGKRYARCLTCGKRGSELTEPECIAARKGFVMSESREERASFDREDRKGLSNGR